MARFLHPLQHLLQQTRLLAHPRLVAGTLAGTAGVVAIAWYLVRKRRPTEEEMERRRREVLTVMGRLTDGSIVDARTLANEESTSPAPEVLLYRYRIAGVTYDCAQDVSRLPECTAGYRIDQPVQVRYDPRNPGNSIIVSEVWSGLRMKPQRVLPFETNGPQA